MPSEAQTIFARQVGYTLRGVTPTCLLLVRGSSPLFIDLTSRPIALRQANGEDADLELELDAADAAAIGPGKEHLVDAWIASGRIRASGRGDTVSKLRQRLRGGIPATRYEEIAEQITDARFVFVNHGFVELDGSETFDWVKPVDRPWRYNLNLVRQLTRDVTVDGARVLDIGSGRGGTCSYFARYHRAAQIVGMDLVQGQVDFCRATHHAPNLRFEQGDAQHLPFETGSFDVVTNIESSHCYPSLDAFFAEVRRVLRPGGIFCYTDNLPAGEIQKRADHLSAYGDVRWTRRITPEVIEALTQCRDEFMALVKVMASDAGSRGAYLEQFAGQILQCRNNYVAGAWDYGIWQMVRQ